MRAGADLLVHDVANRCIRVITGEQTLHGEVAMPVAPAVADVDHRHDARSPIGM